MQFFQALRADEELAASFPPFLSMTPVVYQIRELSKREPNWRYDRHGLLRRTRFESGCIAKYFCDIRS
jgi:hypothetical protein